MVKHVVARGEVHAPNPSPIDCFSWLVVVVLDIDAAGQWQDMAAATTAPAAMTALPGVAAEMGVRVWRGEWGSGLVWVFSATGGMAQGGQERTMEDARVVWAGANLA
jgi:hypothetical protein